MTTPPYDTDRFHAAVTVAAQRIAAYCEKQDIAITPAQCEELAVTLMHQYQAFQAGVRYATEQASSAEPGQ